jgi:hypothetical protein
MPRSPLPRRRRAATPDALRAACGAVLVLLALACGVARGDGVAAVETGGFGTLTKCRSWLFLNSCHTYYHVAVPGHIGLGDQLDITFGSNLKEYFFPVALIALDRESCTLYSEKDATPGDGDRIAISPCRRGAPAPASPAK